MADREIVERILQLKAVLLAGSQIQVSGELLERCEQKSYTLARVVRTDNIYSHPWLFVRLSDASRVRMVVVGTGAPFELRLSEVDADRYDILDSETAIPIAVSLELEEALYHCPRQLFYDLYGFCSVGCKFCPLPFAPSWVVRDTLEKMIRDLDRVGIENLEGIGLTSGIPFHLSSEEVALEMASIVRTLRAKVGSSLPIGVSPMQPARGTLIALKDAGADEIRLNLETYNRNLASSLIPGKDPERTFRSVASAVEIFGRGKVSSNIILGIGETDEDVISGANELAKLGAIATLYPYDMVPEREQQLAAVTHGQAGRPTAMRLVTLAREHKRILETHKLDPGGLMTMCPRCAASHIMPGIDL